MHGRAVEGLRPARAAYRLDRGGRRHRSRGSWGYQDYTTLTPTMLSDRLARAAVEPRRRERDSRSHASNLAAPAAPSRGLGARPRRCPRPDPATSGSDRSGPLPAADRIGGSLRPAAPREIRPDHARGPLRDRQVPADRATATTSEKSREGFRAIDELAELDVSGTAAGRLRPQSVLTARTSRSNLLETAGFSGLTLCRSCPCDQAHSGK